VNLSYINTLFMLIKERQKLHLFVLAEEDQINSIIAMYTSTILHFSISHYYRPPLLIIVLSLIYI